MTSRTGKRCLLFFAFISGAALAGPNKQLTVGDGQIDGTRIKPYRLTWLQCSLQDGSWQKGPALTEELVVIGEHTLRHRQIASPDEGVVSQATTYFDRGSFAPMRMEQLVSRDGMVLVNSERQLSANGYTGIDTRGGETQALKGAISSKMLHGGAMGLPLAALPPQDAPLEFSASMISFDGTYSVVAEWVGVQTLKYDGVDVEASLVDVGWLHHESGDVYAAGPEASGGRYWIVANPPAGFPYVPRYKTDTYAVEFIRSVCPGDQ